MKDTTKIILILLSISLSSFADNTENTLPSEGIFYNQYYSIYLGKIKCGWARFWNERKKDKIISKSKTYIKIGRENTSVEINQLTENIEKIDGTPVYLKDKISFGKTESIYECFFGEKWMKVNIKRGDITTKYKFPLSEKIHLSWSAYLKTKEYLNKTGAEFTLNTYDPQIVMVRPVKVTFRILGKGKTTIAGKTIEGIRVLSTIHKPVSISSYTICDTSGNPLYMLTNMGMFTIHMVADDEKHAKEGIAEQDILRQTLILANKPIDKNKNELIFKITLNNLKQSLNIFNIPNTELQKVLHKTQSSVIIKCSRPFRKFSTGKPHKIPTSIKKKYLTSSSLIPLEDTFLKSLAQKATGGAKNPYFITQNMCMFVYGYIRNKNMSNVFDDAAHIARTRSGDCTEHSVLLIALLREVGIPARGVMGVVYSPKLGGKYGGFAYHMWVQAYVHNRWIDIDPALGQIIPDSTHIAMSISAIDDKSSAEILKLVKFIGNVKIENLEKGK